MPKGQRCRAPLLRPFTPMENIVTALLIRGDSRTTIEKKLAMTSWSVNNHLAHAAAKIPGNLRCRMKIHFWGRGATVDQLTGEGWMPGPPDREPL